jgi:putative restriction endonuclease
MAFDPGSLVLGHLYSRPELAALWGYASSHAISRGVFTPAKARHIVLFVTRQKQKGLTQYEDFLSGDSLHWDGEQGHRSDIRIARAAESGDTIHLLYRDIHHTPFRYHGEVRLLQFKEHKHKPSEFVLELVHDLGPSDDIQSHAAELETLPATERDTVVRARIGQGQFREELLKFWRGCAVTKVAQADLLRASHIKPWRDSSNTERLDPCNGLLLLPQYDLLFDRGYITFDESGNLEPSRAIDSLPAEKLGIDRKARLQQVVPGHLGFLEYHRREVFLKELGPE